MPKTGDYSGTTEDGFTLNANEANAVKIAVPVDGTAWVLTMPTDAGLPGQVWATDGTGRGSWVNQSGSSGGTSSYETTFTDASLSIAGWLPVVHNLGSYPSGVAVFNDVGMIVNPDELDVVSVNAISVNLASFQPLSGTWRISITY